MWRLTPLPVLLLTSCAPGATHAPAPQPYLPPGPTVTTGRGASAAWRPVPMTLRPRRRAAPPSRAPRAAPEASSDDTTRGLVPVTDEVRGRQRDRDPAHLLTFPVTRGGGCFRVVARGGPGVEDLDLLLRDRRGKVIAADLTADAHPVAPPSGLACIRRAGVYVLEVSVHRGAGEFAVRVWSPRPAAL